MVDKDILSFIKDGAKDGFSLEELREKLKEIGIDGKEIDSAIVAFKKEGSHSGEKKEDTKMANNPKVKKDKDVVEVRKEDIVGLTRGRPAKKQSEKPVKKVIKMSKKHIVKKRASKHKKEVKQVSPVKKVKTVKPKVKRDSKKTHKHIKKKIKPKKKKEVHKTKSHNEHKKHFEAKRAIDKALKDLESEIVHSLKEKELLKKEIYEISSSLNRNEERELDLKRKISSLEKKEMTLKHKKSSLQAKVNSINNKLGKITRLKSEISDIA